MTTPKPKCSVRRKALLAKSAVACKQLGIEAETLAELLAANFGGKRSRTKLHDGELGQLIEIFRRQGFVDRPRKDRKGRRQGPQRAGGTPLAEGKQAGKLRALWVAGYHLGVIRSPEESALRSFVRRITGVEALEWVRQAKAEAAIEAIKAMLAREAGVDWSRVRFSAGSMEWPRYRVIEAQVRLLIAAGGQSEAEARQLTADLRFPQMSDAEQDALIERLGGIVRRIKS